MIFWIFFLLLILLGIWFCIEQHVLRVRKQTLSLEHLPAGWTVFPCCKSPICTTGKWAEATAASFGRHSNCSRT